LAGYAYIFDLNVRASGVIPQISVILGPCAGGAVYSPALADFVCMCEDRAHMFITGPEVIRPVTGEEVTHDELGGAIARTTKPDAPQLVGPNEQLDFGMVAYLMSLLPANSHEIPPYFAPSYDPERREVRLRELLPDTPNKAYDMGELIRLVVDDGELFEVHE